MSETENQQEETDTDPTVGDPNAHPAERTAPPSNPDPDTDRLEIEEEDADRTIAT